MNNSTIEGILKNESKKNQYFEFENIFNRSSHLNLQFSNKYNGIDVAYNKNMILEVMKLRNKVFKKLGYTKEFEENIPGILYDEYDQNSIILIHKRNKTKIADLDYLHPKKWSITSKSGSLFVGHPLKYSFHPHLKRCGIQRNKITGSLRIIFDSKKMGLPTDSIFSFKKIRKNNLKIAELNKLIVEEKYQNSGIEFRNLFFQAYQISKKLNINKYVTAIKKEHYKLYEKFGGVDILAEISNYGQIKQSSLILSWDPGNVSTFFKKYILKIK